jgi:hypothetical protein
VQYRNSPRPKTVKNAKQGCGNCGRTHDATQLCPAKGTKCDNCNKWNHFAAVCRSNIRVGEVTAQPDYGGGDDSDDDFYIDSIDLEVNAIDSPTLNTDQAFRYLNIGPGRIPIEFKLDTGSQVNILPMKYFKGIGSLSSLKKATKHLYDYSKSRLDTVGEQRIQCAYRDKIKDINFFIVKTDAVPILGLQSCVDLNLIQLVMLVESKGQVPQRIDPVGIQRCI